MTEKIAPNWWGRGGVFGPQGWENLNAPIGQSLSDKNNSVRGIPEVEKPNKPIIPNPNLPKEGVIVARRVW